MGKTTALKYTWQQIDEKNLGLVAAGIGFFAALALFPSLAAMIALWGIFADPAELQSQLEALQAVVPEDIFDLINTQITALINTRTDKLGWATLISIGLALWSAKAGVSALMRGLNMIHGSPNRSTVKHYLDAVWITVLIVFVALVALGSVVVAPILLAFFQLGGFFELLIDLIRWGLVVGVLIFALGVIYRWGPNKRAVKSGWFSPGAIMTVLLWVMASSAFSIYLSRFSNYNEIYGSIGAVMALLMWFYISAFLVLLGASYNIGLARKSGEIVHLEQDHHSVDSD